MKGKTNLQILFLVTAVVAVIAVAAYMLDERGSGERMKPRELFSNLNIDQVAEVEIVGEEETFSLKSEGEEGWGLVSRGGYSIDDKRLSRLIYSIAGLMASDRMTTDAEKYDQLGVGEDKPENGYVRLLDGEGKQIAGLFVGRERERPAQTPGGFPIPDGQYVRVDGDAAVYKIKEAMTLDTSPMQWLVRDVLKVEADNLQTITVRHDEDSTDTFTIARTGSDPFELTTPLPEGWRDKSAIAATLSRALSNMTLTDVLPGDDAKVAGIAFEVSFSATQKNGLVFDLEAGKLDDDTYARITGRYDPAADLSLSDERTSDSVTAKAMELAEVTLKNVNETHGNWVYQIPSYQYDNLVKTFSDMLEEIPEPVEPEEDVPVIEAQLIEASEPAEPIDDAESEAPDPADDEEEPVAATEPAEPAAEESPDQEEAAGEEPQAEESPSEEPSPEESSPEESPPAG